MSEKTQCDNGQGCANVIEARSEQRIASAELSAQVKHLTVTVQDMREAVSGLPDRVAAAIRDEREKTEKEFTRGSTHFKTLYERVSALENSRASRNDFDEMQKRLGRVEKILLVIAVILALSGAFTGATYVWPSILPASQNRIVHADMEMAR